MLSGMPLMPGEGLRDPWFLQQKFTFPKDIAEGLTGPGMRLPFTSHAFYFFPLQLLTLSPHLLLMSELCYCQASFIEKIGIILCAFLAAYKDKKGKYLNFVLC